MKVKIVSVFLAVLLIGLFLPGCVSKGELEECEALAADQAAQIEDLEAQNDDQMAQIASLKEEIKQKDAQIAELEEEISNLKEQIPKDTAKLEITFNPNPVPCQDGHWHWRVTIRENNGVGVKFEHMIREFWYEGRLSVRTEGSSEIARIFRLDSSYLPAYGAASAGFGFPCQKIEYEILTLVGIDDNGHKVKGVGRVDFHDRYKR